MKKNEGTKNAGTVKGLKTQRDEREHNKASHCSVSVMDAA